MSQFKYEHLFTPIILGRTYFRNRIFASPTGYQDVNGDGYLHDGLSAAAYYERKAKGGAASVTTCEVIVDGELGKSNSSHISQDTEHIERNLARIAYGIKSYGAVASMELNHTGMFANRDLSFFGAAAKGIAYGPVETELDGRLIRPMDEEIIERTIRKFAQAGALAKKSGFGMVTIQDRKSVV
jgi:2,4-dienoyl-CoA reductase-like NADH-dependent reductase (Old Yellow Enzyme family)